MVKCILFFCCLCIGCAGIVGDVSQPMLTTASLTATAPLQGGEPIVYPDLQLIGERTFGPPFPTEPCVLCGRSVGPHVALPMNAAPSSSQWTVAASVTVTDLTDSRIFFGSDDGVDGQQLYIGLSPPIQSVEDECVVIGLGDSGTIWFSARGEFLNTETEIVVSYSEPTCSVYINGVFEHSFQSPYTRPDAHWPWVGAVHDLGSGRPFVGTVHWLQVYDGHALQPDELYRGELLSPIERARLMSAIDRAMPDLGEHTWLLIGPHPQVYAADGEIVLH